VKHEGIGGHHSAAARTVDWLTPPEIITALGGAESFDLDPCASENQPWQTARRHYTRRDNGLMLPWEGRVYLNPPYSTEQLRQWMARMSAHNFGTALIFARTETDVFFKHVWECAAAVMFIRGRLNFHLPNGRRATKNSGAPSILIAYGMHDADVLAYAPIDGQFFPLRIPQSVLIRAAQPSWRELVEKLLKQHGGPVPLADLYRAAAEHPKARKNRHYEAKIRQTLQQGRAFRHAGPGLWEWAGEQI
jgi:phage N-6-adenine-methyltransferase